MPSLNIPSNGVTLRASVAGADGDPVLLLLSGMGEQLIHWPAGLIELLVSRGYRVVTFDHRDRGLSTSCGPRELPPSVDGATAGYDLGDLAADALGLLAALDVSHAHLLGRSMGGMVAQEMLLREPSVALSATLVSSSLGALPADADALAMVAASPTNRAEYVESEVGADLFFAGSAYPADPEVSRARAEAAFDRSFNPGGHLRQFLAYLATPLRTLSEVSTPVVVIHGDEDPVIPVDRGRELAESLPGALLEVIEGWGHDLPPAVWDRIAGAVGAA